VNPPGYGAQLFGQLADNTHETGNLVLRAARRRCTQLTINRLRSLGIEPGQPVAVLPAVSLARTGAHPWWRCRSHVIVAR
jgi:hypothetical protein